MDSIFNYTLTDLENVLNQNGFKPFHGKQIFKWLYDKRVNSFDEMSDLSIKLREFLNSYFVIDSISLKTKQESSDGTIKYLFELEDGCLIETVLMYFDYGTSICISTQVGCNMGCKFCASGLLKKQRDLRVGEIVQEVLYVSNYLRLKDDRLDNIVVMGTGEPFDNYDNVLKALEIINCPFGIEIGARHISVSTCGLVPKIYQFADEKKQYNLAISLHAPDDDKRNKLMPVNNSYNLKELFDALRYYYSQTKRRISFEYLLLSDINDTKQDADNIAMLLNGLDAYINLIPYNNVDENGFKSSSDEKVLAFYDMLKKRNVDVTLRQKRGTDIDAACGQLRAKNMV